MNSEEIKEMCRLQQKDFMYKVLISKMPIAYTQDDIGRLEHDMQIKSKYEQNQEQMVNLIKKYEEREKGIIEKTFGNKEIMEQNKFTFDEQREVSKEVIGKEITMEEFCEKYCR